MDHKPRRKKSSERNSRSPSSGASGPSGSPQRQPSRKRLWLMRLTAGVLLPALLLCVAEGALRLSSYGHSPKFFEPLGDGGTLTTNPKFAWQFYSKKTATSPTPI